MIDDNEIKRQLHSPATPEDLERDIRAACNALQDKSVKHGKVYWPAYALMSIVGVILLSVLISITTTTPNIVTTAVADIKKDEFIGAHLVEKYRPWLSQKKINLPPEEMTVEMSKFCKLSGQLSFHLKIAGQRQGKVHLFILKNNPGIASGKRSGKVATMSWRIINPRDKLYVLVLFTKDMKKESVNKLIRKMFYA